MFRNFRPLNAENSKTKTMPNSRINVSENDSAFKKPGPWSKNYQARREHNNILLLNILFVGENDIKIIREIDDRRQTNVRNRIYLYAVRIYQGWADTKHCGSILKYKCCVHIRSNSCFIWIATMNSRRVKVLHVFASSTAQTNIVKQFVSQTKSRHV